MPLNDHEQQILDEIERRLAEDDPKLVEQVARTDLYTHLTRRIRLAGLAFIVGVLLLLLFVVSVWIAVAGFVVMVVSAVMICALPRAARARPDPRDAGRRAALDQRDHGSDRRAPAAAGAALEPRLSAGADGRVDG